MNGAALPLVLLGAGGHAQVLLGLLRACGCEVLGVCDPALALAGLAAWEGLPVLGDDHALQRWPAGRIGLVNGLGMTPARPAARRHLFERHSGGSHVFPALVHPAAWVAPDAQLGAGVQVMAGAVVQPGSRLGDNTIVNTRASVDHGARIAAHVHLAPGCVLCGDVHVGEGAFVGAGAVLLPSCCVGARAVVAAGATVVRDVAAETGVRGVPARPFCLERSFEGVTT
jgi:sugar O-acyltransferase (sialic acid O-acetyltransferase NeuD family)